MLVDGNNILIRAVKATERAQMSANGIPTGALHVFINTLARHIREERPSHIVVAWDGGRSVYRLALYEAYKGNRPPRTEEEDEARPFSQAKEFLTLAGIHHIERAGWEADDVIAAYHAITDMPMVVLSSDKDLLQLVDWRTEQVRVSSSPPTYRWDVPLVEQEMGCTPADIPSLMALTGDPGDNVPGVKGIGPKKGAALLAASGWDLEAAIADLPADQQTNARLSRSLVDLVGLNYPEIGLLVPPVPAFEPTHPGSVAYGDLLDFLDRYQLAQTREKFINGSLWSEQKAGV